MVALSYLSVNSERYPPEAQDATASLIGVLPRIRTAVILFHHRLRRRSPFPKGEGLVQIFDCTACQRDIEDAVPYKAGM